MKRDEGADRAGGLLGAVVIVRDLARSESFYRELLELHVETSSTEAVLLSTRGGDRLVLHALGKAPHVAGGIGVLFLVWTTETAADLARCEKILRTHDAFVSRSVDDGWDVLEGRDPDDIRIIVVFPPASDPTRTSLPVRIYNY